MRTATYALDLNVLIDLTKRRPQRYEAACELIRAGLNHLVRLVVTDEASCELIRATGGGTDQDPLVEIMLQIPTLPRVDRATLAHLAEKLRQAIFPRRSRNRRNASQDESDLIHLATCIHHKISGFITGERAILRASEALRREFDLEILSPFDFMEPTFSQTPSKIDLTVSAPEGETSFQEFSEADRSETENFLKVLGLSDGEVHSALAPGASGSDRKRVNIVVGGRLVGFASWERPAKLKVQAELFFYLDETVFNAERIIDHILESVSRDSRSMGVHGIQLHHGKEQTSTREAAISRGFRRRGSNAQSASRLFKISLFGFVDSSGWSALVADLRRLAHIDLDPRIPEFEKVSSLGIHMVHGAKRQPAVLSLFDFETIISPGLLLLPGRGGVIVPIQEAYAEELLGRQSPQVSFLPAREAVLRVEKAYFRTPVQVNLFAKGTPLVFYVSAGRSTKRRGPMAALCMARVTSTAVIQAEEALFRYQRQGVLSREELYRMADKEARLHVFTPGYS